ncbi:MAG TPA: hypothetical protein VFE98_05510 [Candidatus Bathyarchaeia archaeon]|nr:hypothetical protein [Candidatus Bathyarchaeia archaeon]
MFLLVLSEISLILGAYFYVYPGVARLYWLWPLQALAARFLGAIFLSIPFGCWSALREPLWQRGKILVLVGAIFFGLTSIVSVIQPVQNNILQWVWTTYFVAASAGCLIILGRHGWKRRPQDLLRNGTAPSTARIFLRVQTVIVALFGTLLFIFPDLSRAQFWPWKVGSPNLQIFGALFLATCLATGWASIQRDLRRITVLLPIDAAFPSLALLAVALHWNVIAAESPSPVVTIVWLGLYSVVATGALLVYLRARTTVQNH